MIANAVLNAISSEGSSTPKVRKVRRTHWKVPEVQERPSEAVQLVFKEEPLKKFKVPVLPPDSAIGFNGFVFFTPRQTETKSRSEVAILKKRKQGMFAKSEITWYYADSKKPIE